MSAKKRTSIRITDKRQAKLGDLKEAWGFKTADDTMGFLIDIADAEKMSGLAKQQLSRIKANRARIARENAEITKALSLMSLEQREALLKGKL